VRYAGLDKKDIPHAESLKLTVERFLPYWNDVIAPSIKEGKKVTYYCLSIAEQG